MDLIGVITAFLRYFSQLQADSAYDGALLLFPCPNELIDSDVVDSVVCATITLLMGHCPHAPHRTGQRRVWREENPKLDVWSF